MLNRGKTITTGIAGGFLYNKNGRAKERNIRPAILNIAEDFSLMPKKGFKACGVISKNRSVRFSAYCGLVFVFFLFVHTDFFFRGPILIIAPDRFGSSEQQS